VKIIKLKEIFFGGFLESLTIIFFLIRFTEGAD